MNSFSIIVPIYNVELYLKKCLDSLINQNYNNYEIILINDGSTDNSESIIKEYSNKYPELIKSYKKKNGGLSSARNYGIKKASKEYLLFVDSDDYIEKNTLSILNEELNINKKDIIVFNYIAKYSDKEIKVNTFNNNINDLEKKYILSIPSACNKLVKKEIFTKNKIEFPNGLYYEDLATMPLLINCTNNISFIDEYLYIYNSREDSITNKKKYNKKMDDIFKVCQILKDNLNKEYKDEVEYLYIEHLLRNAGLRFLAYNKYDKLNNVKEEIEKNYSNYKDNKYYKNYYTIKQKIMCNLLMKKKYNLIKLIKKLKGEN